MWFFYALASTVFASVRRTNEKRISQTLHHYSVGWTVQGLSLPVLAMAMLLSHGWRNPFQMPWVFWLVTGLIWLVYYPLNTICYVKAYRTGEFSKILPLQSMGPVFALLLGWMVFSQVPSMAAISAIAIIVCSVYVLNMIGWRLHNPLHMFTADAPNLYMLGSIGLTAIASLLDVLAIRASNAQYYGFVSTIGAVPVLYSAGRLCGVRERAAIYRQLPCLSVAGGLFGLSYGSCLLSFAHGLLAYATAVRGSSMFIGAAIGIIWLGERLTRQKLIAFTGMAAGLVILALVSV